MSISGNDYAFGFSAKTGFYYIKKAVDSNDENITYYAFGDKFGNFYIMKLLEDCSSGYALYYKGTPDMTFDTVWAARETITYDYPWDIFNEE